MQNRPVRCCGSGLARTSTIRCEPAMITYVNGNLFEAPAKVLVNTVNTVGAMGKGIALEFKRIYPPMFRRYQQFCETGQLTVGKLYLYRTDHKWVLNFPTKKHWRSPSRLEYIEAGLQKFCDSHVNLGITSIAFPALGCGNGELDYETQVRSLMEKYLGDLPISIFIYLNGSRHAPPEHKDTERIAAWLRSNPPSLPFDEVWTDVNEILATKGPLRTIDGQFEFVAISSYDPPSLTVKIPNQVLSCEGDELWMFWQRLRDHGLVYKGILQDHLYAPFLMAIFGLLPYVQSVDVSQSVSGLWTKPYTGLQVAPDVRTGYDWSNDSLGELYHVTQA